MQADYFLQRVAQNIDLGFSSDYLELYKSVPNENLRTIFASWHSSLNSSFEILNDDLRTETDKDGNLRYTGGYFHAQDSRDLLAVIDHIRGLQKKLENTPYRFTLTPYYAGMIKFCRGFVEKSGGSTIPEDTEEIDIIELEPVFFLSDTVTITHDVQAYYAQKHSIGEGSYAKVSYYVDPLYCRRIVIKRANKDLTIKEIERFQQEYRILNDLCSPYIVEVYSYNDQKNEYTMEYMDETIYDYIRRENDKLTLQQRKNLIYQICKGLKYIHSKGYLHRDISLCNIMVKHYDDVDVVKICDFGLVKIPESSFTSLNTEIKGSLNDANLINVGFANYEIRHETFALTRLCFYILTGKTNVSRQKDGQIKQFWLKGTNSDINKRYNNVDEVMRAVSEISEKREFTGDKR